MPATNATTESDGFSAQERAAMKKRAAELRAEGARSWTASRRWHRTIVRSPSGCT